MITAAMQPVDRLRALFAPLGLVVTGYEHFRVADYQELHVWLEGGDYLRLWKLDGQSRWRAWMEDVTARLARIEQLVTGGEAIMAADLAALQAQVSRNNDVVQSALTLIQGLRAQLEAAKNDPVAIQAMLDQLNANDTALATAVADNTVAAV